MPTPDPSASLTPFEAYTAAVDQWQGAHALLTIATVGVGSAVVILLLGLLVGVLLSRRNG